MTLKRTVGILLFNEVEVLDFAGPFEVFSLAENAANNKYFDVITIAENQAPISARNGLQVIPDYNLASYPDIDVISHTRFVDASDDTCNIVTSAGISAGIHASLYCIEKLIDSKTMSATAHRMEFDIN
ncbi:type 1 glutamine amidotransferase family protein [Psychrobacter fozii]|uniref:hypothetical protein n=1 Tax=Psychrobacter fozii TaxID=198480 RepID=UPI001917A44B|nr:hypothetical protein [Psychrobacter fozii]